MHAFPDRAQELVAILTLACGESRAGDLRVFGLDGDEAVETERVLRARSTTVFEPETFPTDALGGAYCSVFVRNGWTWPSLAVRFSCTPAEAGFHPEAILIPETSRVLIGAGESVFVYGLDSPRRIHTESAELGFMHWARQDDVIVMSAELELAAFNLDGTKRWTLFVEPPWSFDIHDGILHLDVMGTLSSFPVREGPR